MHTKELIIRLIQENLKYSQFIIGLNNLGLEAGCLHHIRLFEVVSDLMEVPEGDIEFTWGLVYTSFMNKAVEYNIEGNSEGLRSLAECCYDKLAKVLNVADSP